MCIRDRESAEQARQAGLDVVIGLLSCEQWPQTQFLAEKFEVLPYKTIIRAGRTDYEMDLDACLKRAPDLILVDDLSHLNMDVSRHMKRYQDIAELLKAGVDVYTTLNVQHIESIQDTVFSILGLSLIHIDVYKRQASTSPQAAWRAKRYASVLPNPLYLPR